MKKKRVMNTIQPLHKVRSNIMLPHSRCWYLCRRKCDSCPPVQPHWYGYSGIRSYWKWADRDGDYWYHRSLVRSIQMYIANSIMRYRSFLYSFLIMILLVLYSFLIMILLVAVSYFLCNTLNESEVFWAFLEKVGESGTTRSILLFFRKVTGCSGRLAPLLFFAGNVFPEIFSCMYYNVMPSSGASSSNPGNPAPIDQEVSLDDFWDAVDAEERRQWDELQRMEKQ